MRSSKEESANCEEMALRNGLVLGMCACYFGGVYGGGRWRGSFLRGAGVLRE
nr:MAG TPA: hypothetical protein [Caudoviricetes sp.]